MVICLAPELYRKYDTLYVYLQNDFTRQKPSVELILHLLCEDERERLQARNFFSGDAPLFRFEILKMTEDQQSPSGSSDLACFLKLEPRIVNFLLGNNSIDRRLVNLAKLYIPEQPLESLLVADEVKTRLINLTQGYVENQNSDRENLVLHLKGLYGAGKRDTALGVCKQLNTYLLYLDLELLVQETDAEKLLRLLFRESLLLRAPVYLDNIDGFLEQDVKTQGKLKTLVRTIAEFGWVTILAGEKKWPAKRLFEAADFHSFELPLAEVPLRQKVWEQELSESSLRYETAWTKQLARQFRLTPQIRDAVEQTKVEYQTRNGKTSITLTDLCAACHKQSNQKLSELSVKIKPKYVWQDIVLPADKVSQLKEICLQVKHRYRVFDEWGFEKKLSYGKGASALFSGPLGTGKTMAAEVIANELQLELYKIDLSSVVSKYIGETEKNLAKIFDEAETSNTILFFDEADALFGKRTQVSDAHDRYANIETSYLLQKMEEYNGIVILATNLRENMDDAFTRRIRFIVEFPFPDAASREQIWMTHFPGEAPVSGSINFSRSNFQSLAGISRTSS